MPLPAGPLAPAFPASAPRQIITAIHTFDRRIVSPLMGSAGGDTTLGRDFRGHEINQLLNRALRLRDGLIKSQDRSIQRRRVLSQRGIRYMTPPRERLELLVDFLLAPAMPPADLARVHLRRPQRGV